jgi:hypothetical protein
LELQMMTEIETLYSRLEKLRMTPADRALAAAHLAQAEAFAATMHSALAALRRLIPARNHRGTHHSGLHPSA